MIEGVGDHGCEYMTGGRAVILGPTGRNFAAGMSGGIAYVYDPDQALLANCNLEMVLLERVVAEDDVRELRDLIDKHRIFTESEVAARILDDWETSVTKFTKVVPADYKRAMEQLVKENGAAENPPDDGPLPEAEPSAEVIASPGGQT